ncbi:histidinol-phosphate transaminase [Herbiconiux sp. L3-i23]|uniref:histidinol-phosphate transaminase n=1 Tax=Herbiconiux sp. L3-i23 TaxID=2905871 RepID=UPI00205269AF|nr:histidinol-phosphate transaminase [Herbiconiux sp. L3-i23]BDI22225.1 histidinol-phosphate aminotransferase [Herbiconiux sp. L3-i23]
MTSLDDLPIRDDLRGREPYGAPQRTVKVALNVNENSHGVPEDVAHDIVRQVAEAILTIHRYPDREFTVLRERLAGYLGHGLSAANIWAANGSNEVTQQVLQAFGGPGRSVLGFPPTYSMHSILAGATGTEWVEGRRDEGFRISPETVVAEIDRTRPDIVFLCAPNNPTGTGVPLETIAAAYDAFDGMVFVDEAYAEFMPSGAPSALTLLPDRPRLMVSRTMSKAFAFAGARVGYLASDPAVADALRLVRLPYHLSALTQAAAIAALGHADEMLGMVEEIKVQRDRLMAELPGLGYSPWPSEANFVLFGGVADPHATWQHLLDHDVLVRDLGIPNTLRVSAGTESETTAFLAALSGADGALGARS